MRALFRRAARTACVLLACASGATAHIRLVNPNNNNALRWNSPHAVSIVIRADGSDDLAQDEHVPALRLAIREWNSIAGSSARLIENTSPAQRARTDWHADDLHSIWFDEDNDSGYFSHGSGIVALTPIWFASSGVITDADVIFNGSGFTFTTSGESGAFDVQDVGTHELGHLLGLDHTAWAGGTMYPYVDPQIVLHRSVALDEVHGLREAYPNLAFASLRGVLRTQGGDPLRGAHVVARDVTGRPRASALTRSNGSFVVSGLDAGAYSLYAAPFEGPVGEGNLTGGQTVDTELQLTSLGAYLLDEGEVRNIGTLQAEDDETMSLGRSSDDLPLRAIRGTTRAFALRGIGLSPGSTLHASDASISLSSVSWSGTIVNFSVTTPSDAAIGHVDLIASDMFGARCVLTAAIEITPPSPLVASVVPVEGALDGGDVLTLSGVGFLAGCAVVIGGHAYVDGVDCQVVSDTVITLTTVAGSAGAHDVVVIDPCGVEGRASAAFAYRSQPAITSVFPPAGSAAGHTQVSLLGTSFVAGSTVRIDGVPQPDAVVVDATQILVTTVGGLPGGPYQVEVEAPDGGLATALFSYVASADPHVAAVEPSIGSTLGGDVVTIHGANFTPASQVVFGADEATGLGGDTGARVTFVDAHTLMVVTPAAQSGMRNVLVRNVSSGQASLLPGAFRFTGGGGGGGGCTVAPLDGATPPFDATGLVPLLLLAAWLASRARANAVLR